MFAKTNIEQSKSKKEKKGEKMRAIRDAHPATLRGGGFRVKIF